MVAHGVVFVSIGSVVPLAALCRCFGASAARELPAISSRQPGPFEYAVDGERIQGAGQ